MAKLTVKAKFKKFVDVDKVVVEQWKKPPAGNPTKIPNSEVGTTKATQDEWGTAPFDPASVTGADRLVLRVVATKKDGTVLARVSVPPRRFPKQKKN